MTVTVKNIIPAKLMENAQTTQYTAVACTASITQCSVTNVDTANRTFSVNLVAPAGSAATSNLIIDEKTIVPGETYLCPELINQTLPPGGFISTIASAANALVIRASGREIT